MSKDWHTLSPDQQAEVLEFSRLVLRNRATEFLEAARSSPAQLRNREAVIETAQQLAELLREF